MKDYPMADKGRRKVERFALELPSQIMAIEDSDQEILKLLTRDVSAGGAFFYTDKPLPVGTEVKIDLVLPLSELKKLESSKALIKVSGEVIRSEEQGMAVCFNEDYQLSPLPGEKPQLRTA